MSTAAVPSLVRGVILLGGGYQPLHQPPSPRGRRRALGTRGTRPCAQCRNQMKANYWDTRRVSIGSSRSPVMDGGVECADAVVNRNLIKCPVHCVFGVVVVRRRAPSRFRKYNACNFVAEATQHIVLSFDNPEGPQRLRAVV